MTKNKKLIISNWKMNVDAWKDALGLAQKTLAVAKRLKRTEVVVCPSFPHIIAAQAKAKMYHLGAQSASVFENGSHTGDVSAKQLAALGVEYVLAGHSEQRQSGDTDVIVSKRIQQIISAGLTAVVCCGDLVRSEDGAHLEFVKTQLKATLAGVPAEKIDQIVLAYEPVWAIGATAAMEADQVYEMTLFVRKTFAELFGADAGHKVQVLYGGSVKADNAAAIMAVGKVDGLLVGRESVNIQGFTDLLKAVDSATA
jgi:triosephosphate isomerase